MFVNQAAGHLNIRWARFVMLVVAVSLVMLHFVVVQFAKYQLTVAPFTIVLLLLLLFPIRFTIPSLLLFLTLLVFPLINLPQVIGDSAAIVKFSRTYALWAFAVVVACICLGSSQIRTTLAIGKASSVVILIVTFVCIAQVAMVLNFGSTGLFSIFGDNLYGGSPNLERFVGNINRAIGFYYEPSFCALVLVSMVVIQLLEEKLNWLVIGVAAIGVVVTTSVSGIVALLALVAMFVISSPPQAHQSVRSKWQGLILVLTIVSVGVIAAVEYKDYLLTRGSEIGRDGSSIHYRLVAPIAIVKDVLLSRPFGMAFGRMESAASEYQMLNGDVITETIDNGIYLLIFYFGWIAFFALSWLVLYVVYLAIRRRRIDLLFFGYIALAFNFNGAVFSPEDLLLFLLVAYQYRLQSINGSAVTDSSVIGGRSL